MTFNQAHPSQKTKFCKVEMGLRESLAADIHGQPLALRESPGKTEGQTAAACTKISPNQVFGGARWRCGDEIHSKIDHQFRLWPRDQNGRSHLKSKITPETVAHQVLEGNCITKVLAPKPFDLTPASVEGEQTRGIESQALKTGGTQATNGVKQPVKSPRVATPSTQLLSPQEDFSPSERLHRIGRVRLGALMRTRCWISLTVDHHGLKDESAN
jgi:hypothetical protein